MPGWSTPGRMTAVQSMCSACSIPYIVAGNGFGDAHVQVPTTDLSRRATMGTGAAGQAPVSPQAAVGLAFGAVSSFGSVGMMPLPRAGVTASGQWSAVNGQWPVVNSPSDSRIGPGLSLVVLSKDHSAVADSRRDAPVLLDAVLDELISDPVLIRSHAGAHRFELPIFPSGEITDAPVAVGPGLIGASSQSVPPSRIINVQARGDSAHSRLQRFFAE